MEIEDWRWKNDCNTTIMVSVNDPGYSWLIWTIETLSSFLQLPPRSRGDRRQYQPRSKTWQHCFVYVGKTFRFFNTGKTVARSQCAWRIQQSLTPELLRHALVICCENNSLECCEEKYKNAELCSKQFIEKTENKQTLISKSISVWMDRFLTQTYETSASGPEGWGRYHSAVGYLRRRVADWHKNATRPMLPWAPAEIFPEGAKSPTL